MFGHYLTVCKHSGQAFRYFIYYLYIINYALSINQNRLSFWKVLAGDIDPAIRTHTAFFSVWKRYGFTPEGFNLATLSVQVLYLNCHYLKTDAILLLILINFYLQVSCKKHINILFKGMCTQCAFCMLFC